MKNKIRSVVSNNKLLIENMSYMFFLQFFLLIYPLIAYPYLVRVLGRELYGVVLTAQMLVSYASLIIDFGTNYVCPKHVSINRESPYELSKILSNVLAIRLSLFFIVFFVYLIICYVVPAFRENIWLFILTYGFATNDLLFPQFFFQGLEKMKLTSIINASTKLVMVCLIFIIVKNEDDVLWVPVIYSIGFLLGGVISLYQIFGVMKIKLVRPSIKESLYYLKDSSPIFATNIVSTIKDKFNYFLIGSFIGMSEVVVYDLGVKLMNIFDKPYSIINTVLFPRFAKEKNLRKLKLLIAFCFSVTLLIFVVANIFLEQIAFFFLHESVDLLPIRVMLLAPVILSISYTIATNMFVAFGYNKYMFYSIIITTIFYLLFLAFFGITNNLNNVMSFVVIAIGSYFVELVYRLIKARKISCELNKTIV